MGNEGQWADARRVEGWAGEVRVNLIRLAALIAFYGHHLVNVYVLQGDPTLRGTYHATVTVVVLAWGFAVFVLYWCLSRRWVPPALKYVSTLWDLFLITALLVLTRDGPASPLILLYFLVVASSPLRLSLRLVYVATLGSVVAYLLLLGYYAFVLIGAERYYADSAVRIPRTHQVIVVLALGTAGVLAGQAVRQARRLVQGYPVAVEEAKES